MSATRAAGKQAFAVTEGFAYADDGGVYRDPQEAEENALNWMFIGPGTYPNLTVNTPGLEVRGAGRSTLIDGGANHGILVAADDVSIRNLSVQTDVAGDLVLGIAMSGTPANVWIDRTWVRQSDLTGVSTGPATSSLLTGVVVEDSGSLGISAGDNARVYGCEVVSAGTTGIHIAQRGVVAACLVRNSGATGDAGIDLSGNVFAKVIYNHVRGSGSRGIQSNGDDQVIFGNTVQNPADDGIEVVEDDCLVAYNRVHGAGAAGIEVDGTDDIIVSNRVSGSTGSDIDTTQATTPTTANNVTGARN